MMIKRVQFFFLWLLLAIPPLEAAGAADATNSAAGRSSPALSPQAGQPVHINGMVVCFDAEWNQLYLREPGGAIVFLDPRPLQFSPKLGELLEITGTRAPEANWGLTNVVARTFDRQGLPPGRLTRIPDLRTEKDMWIEIIGRVRVAETSRNKLVLVVHADGASCVATVLGPSTTNDVRRFVNSEVRLRGINSTLTANNGALTMYVPSIEQVQIIKAPNLRLADVPVQSIADLLSRELGPWTNTVVHINGLVASSLPGESLFVKGPTGLIRAQVVQATSVQPGERVGVWGYLHSSTNESFLQDAYFEVAQPTDRVGLPANPSSPPRALPQLFTEASEILKLRPDEAALGTPIQLQGVITYADPEWRNGFLQDKTGGIYFELAQAGVRAGDWVELKGQTSRGGFAPDIVSASVNVLATTNLPAPLQVDLEDLAHGQLDAQWVEMDGIVRQIQQQWHHAYLTLMTRKGKFRVLVPGLEQDAMPTNLVDAFVSVRGAVGSDLNARGQLSGITLHAPSLQSVKIVEPAPVDPFAIQSTLIASLAKFDPERIAGRRSKVSGVVTLEIPGQGFYLQDDSGGILVQIPNGAIAAQGQTVEVLGFPSPGGVAPIFDEAVWRAAGASPPVRPKSASADEVLQDGANDGVLVQITGRLLEDVPPSAGPRLVLQDGSAVFGASFPKPAQIQSSLTAGSLVRLTGVCSIQGNDRHDPTSFQMLLRGSGDVELLRSPPWMTPGRAGMLAGSLVLIIASALGWVILLRKEVRAKTSVIEQKLRERNQFAESLAREKNLLATLIDHIPDNIFVKDRTGRYVLTNRAHTAFHGVSGANAFLGKSASEVVAGDMAAYFVETDAMVMDEARPLLEHEAIMRDFRGEPRWMSTTKVPLKDASGSITGLVGISRDVTERRKAEDQLRQLSSVVEQSPVSILITGKSGRIEYVNPAFTRSTGHAESEVMGAELRSVKRVDGNSEPRHLLWNGDRAALEWKGEIRGLRQDGTPIWESVRIGPIIDRATGEISHFLAIYEDISDRKQAEADLAKAHSDLIRTSRMAGMAEVATGVLHNIGNVLNSVNVSSTLVTERLKKSRSATLAKVVVLLREQEADLGRFLTSDPRGQQVLPYLTQLADHLADERQEALDELAGLQRNIDHIKEIVTMQQSFARISGVTETLPVAELLDDALKMHGAALARHHVQVTKHIDSVPPITVDKHKVLQILVNLIANAKHACQESGRPGKHLSIRVVNGQDRIRIAVTDNGIGIPPENLTRIFSHGFTTKRNGHGFGLHSGALAAREIGGSLAVASAGVGQGATFTLDLPLQPPAKG